jgi:general secretion pathway protein D
MIRTLFAFIIFSALLLGQGTQTIQTPFGPAVIKVPQAEQPAAQAPAQVPAATAPVTATQTPPAAPPPGGAVAGQPAPQQSTVPAQNEASGVALHLVNQDIRQVIQIIGAELNLNYLIDPAVKGTVDINTSETLRRSDLLPILESILKINGATMIKTGNFYQIVPANTAVKQPIEVLDQRATTAPDDQIVMQIIRMRFVAAGEMKNILSPFLTDAGNIVAHETGNIILLTDRRSNIRKLLGILDEFDTSSFEGERVRLLPVKSNRARDVIDDLKTIFSGYAMSEKQSAIRFVAIDRLNSILVVTPNASVFPEVERWLTTLDQPVATAGSRNWVYKVKNAKAADLQKVMTELYGLRTPLPVPQTGASGGSLNPAINPQTQPAGSLPPAASQAQQQQVPLAGGTTNSQTLPIRIIADETNNALVIQATAQEYAEMQRTLEQLDVLRRQVLVDAQVFEVTLDDTLTFGVTAQLQSRGTLNPAQTTASFLGSTLTGTTFAFVGRTRELVAFLNASDNRSKVRTLSAPSVLVSDNGTAQFEVGTEVPIPTSSSVSPVQSGGTNLFAQTISYQTTGVILNVKPQINESGNVTMDINQEISAAAANTVSTLVAPLIGKSAVTSTVVVEDGQTIALGGFIRETTDLERTRIPIVGRIPVVGTLLGNTSNAKTRTELIVLITPHVLRTHADADAATDELKARLKEMKSLLK